jgi:hypothetical protein
MPNIGIEGKLLKCSICETSRNDVKITRIFRSLGYGLKNQYLIVCDDEKCYYQIFDKIGTCVHCAMSADVKEFKFLYVPLNGYKNILMTNILCSDECCQAHMLRLNFMIENLQTFTI